MTGGTRDGSEIAVCGLAGRFPGAADVSAFWRNLCDGVESISRFSKEELRAAGEDADRLADSRYVPARPVLDDVEGFDAAFFGIPPREAEVLDPQHRLFLECAWEAFEDAGYDVERLSGATAVYAGSSFSNYLVHNLYKNRPVMEAFGDFETTLHNVPDSLAVRVGYKLGLKGACCGVQTFCSTSLVAVHLACQALLNYECDTALAGGATVHVPQRRGYKYEDGSILSRDGRCRPFDAGATGTVFGSGVGAAVLRRLEDALADGAPIRAVIRGSAVNNDGSLKASFAAPGVVGQTEVVVEALAASGVDPDTIGMVEAHATGTVLGDPAEVTALTKAFRTKTARRGFCALGSVKGNVGHLDAAAGITGLMKAVLSLQHRRIPATLHVEQPNPQIDFASSPFRVNATLQEWPSGPHPRRAAVSAFGVGGTNAHVVLEEAPEPTARPSSRTVHLLPISARTEAALTSAGERLAAYLLAHPEVSLADVAFTLQQGRRAFERRAAVVAASHEEAAARLRSAGSGRIVERKNPPFRLARGTAPADVEAWEALRAAEPAWAALVDDAREDARGLTVSVDSRGAGVEQDGTILAAAATGGRGALASIGALWTAGVDVDWTALHAGETRRRISLPAYPFQRERHWVEPIPDAPAREPWSWIHRPVWKRGWASVPARPMPARVLAFMDGGGPTGGVIARWRETGTTVVAVRRGESFGGDPTTGYSLDPTRRGDHAALWQDLGARGFRPDAVLHGFALDEPTGGLGAFLSVLYLAATRPAGALSLLVLATGIADVFGDETVVPGQAGLAPLVRVLAQESGDLAAGLLDVEPDTGAMAVATELAGPDGVVAWRRGQRWLLDFDTVPRSASEDAVTRIRPEGVYLITGGLGDVGFALAVHLARERRVKLILTGRTGLPDPGDPRSERIRKVRALEALGADVRVVAADATDAAAMRGVIRSAQTWFGRLDGVVHAAGELGAGTLKPAAETTMEDVERQLAAKARGADVLAAVLDGVPLDFVILTSSLSTVLGGHGYAAYAAANAYQDAFALAQARAGRPWISIDFDQWVFGRPRSAAQEQAVREGWILWPEEGMEVFDRVLRMPPLPRVVISAGPLAERRQRWARSEVAAAVRSEARRRPRPDLRESYLAPRDETERAVAAVWEELLGIGGIGVHDSFFELGGHSLFAARVLSRLRDAFQVALPLDALFEAPTVAELAARVTAARWARTAPREAVPEDGRVEIEI